MHCAACGGGFDAFDVEPGDEITCPHCAESVVIGPPVRGARRVRRSEPDFDAEESDDRVTRCRECGETVPLGDADSGDLVACPACGTDLRVGERVSVKRRVVRTDSPTDAGDPGLWPLVRILTCSKCEHRFDSGASHDGEVKHCPKCGTACRLPAPRTPPGAHAPRGRRAFWLGAMAGVAVMAVLSALVAVAVVAWVVAQRRGG